MLSRTLDYTTNQTSFFSMQSINPLVWPTNNIDISSYLQIKSMKAYRKYMREKEKTSIAHIPPITLFCETPTEHQPTFSLSDSLKKSRTKEKYHTCHTAASARPQQQTKLTQQVPGKRCLKNFVTKLSPEKKRAFKDLRIIHQLAM